MLKGLESGQKYRVKSVTNHRGLTTYEFAKPKGAKVVCRHYTHDVDPWIRTTTQDLNYIEIVKESAYTLSLVQRGHYPYPLDHLAWTKFSKKNAEQLKQDIANYGGLVKIKYE